MIQLRLPSPPSVNRLYANVPGKGPYHISLHVALKRNKGGEASKRQIDLGNALKAVEDLLVKHQVIEDDSLSQTVYMEWTDAPSGCRVQVSEAAPIAAVRATA